jgi:serine/threonine protein kinase
MPEIKLKCPNCERNIEADDSFCGTKVQCPNCASPILIPPPRIEPKLEVAGFVLEIPIGSGGMGEVWLARQKTMDRKVALKILAQAHAAKQEFINRFIREVKNSAKLIHPNIVTAFDAGLDKGIYFLAMEYVDGKGLESMLERDGKIPEKEALRIIRGAAEGLAHAWRKFKIFHRDIKPSNIMIDCDGNPKLMDMGISKNLSDDKSMTMTGVIVGTPCYMSPEQAKSEKNIDFRTDIYSLGATLYHISTGALPFDGETQISIITKHVIEPLISAKGKNPDLSPQCSVLIDIMMAKDPKKRQSSWDEVICDIDFVIAGRYPRKAGLFLPQSSLINIFRNSPVSIKILSSCVAILLCFLILLMTVYVGKSKKRSIKSDKTEKTHTNELSEQLFTALRKSNPKFAKDKCNIKWTDGKMELKLCGSDLSDITPLRNFPIISLDLSGTKIQDLSPLSEMQIRELYLANTNIKDINHLEKMPLGKLILSNTGIKDLSPLKAMPLKELAIDKTKASSLSPIFGLNLETLIFTPQNFSPKDLKRLHDVESLEHIDTSMKTKEELMTSGEFWDKVQEKLKENIGEKIRGRR